MTLVVNRKRARLWVDGVLILSEPNAGAARIAELAVMVMLMNRTDSAVPKP